MDLRVIEKCFLSQKVRVESRKLEKCDKCKYLSQKSFSLSHFFDNPSRNVCRRLGEHGDDGNRPDE
jgi:hypothetical protein